MDRKTPFPSLIRPAIASLRQNGIGLVSQLALGEPDLIPLWFGESDLVPPDFINDAAKRALDEGRTFYTHARGILPLRGALRDFQRRTTGADIALERITVPGAAMLAVVTALQCVVETGDNVGCVSPVSCRSTARHGPRSIWRRSSPPGFGRRWACRWACNESR